MSRLAFEKVVYKTELCNHLLNFQLEEHPIEYRKDPLTGMVSRINIKRTERIKQSKKRMFKETTIFHSSKKQCPFCPENIEMKTPCFPKNFSKRNRLKVGSAVLLPNFYPFGEYHGVAVLSDDHKVGLNEFKSSNIHDGITVCIKYLKMIYRRIRDIRYGSINWNYMPPAGASIIHPHLQVIADRTSSQFQEKLIKNSKSYYQSYRCNYWQDLIKNEKKTGDRFIQKIDNIYWIASYAPQGNNEVLGIIPTVSSILEMDEHNVESLSKSIIKILEGYFKMGISSFNMSFFSGPFNQRLPYYWLNLKISSRPHLQPFYTNDCGFMERLHIESIIETKPEEVARTLRTYLKKIK